MEVIKSKIKLINQKSGTVEVFLSGMDLEVGQGMERVINKYLDPEAGFAIVREQYVSHEKKA